MTVACVAMMLGISGCSIGNVELGGELVRK